MKPRASVSGRDWSLSVQRVRRSASGGVEQLGAAPMVLTSRGPGLRRMVVRGRVREQLWFAVGAPSGVAINAQLRDGRVLQGAAFAGDGALVLYQVPANDAGLSWRALRRGRGAGPMVRVMLGGTRPLTLALDVVTAAAFDRRYGWREPRVRGSGTYQGWRLP